MGRRRGTTPSSFPVLQSSKTGTRVREVSGIGGCGPKVLSEGSTRAHRVQGKGDWWSLWGEWRGKARAAQCKSIGVGDDSVHGTPSTSAVSARDKDQEAEKVVTPQGLVGETVVSGDKESEVEEGDNHKKRLPYMGLAMPLGSHVADKMKARISKHEYVDVFRLPHRDTQAKEGPKEEEWELAPITIDNWTLAFPIYASIYCEKYADRAIAVFKYMDIIRKAQMHF
ncbi:hypothetical protein NDU88_005412 [Pleurodeles waltl]|uniref:Uncharacterized protein n=1 Tax=Pleurodeles waltl TaxID=8319 RepID=A0AAV7SLL1_PLEWA|nr:hypothetical protein NDU88_005412 [Pleurodeles waltl]